jgi:hypothetical protein
MKSEGNWRLKETWWGRADQLNGRSSLSFGGASWLVGQNFAVEAQVNLEACESGFLQENKLGK